MKNLNHFELKWKSERELIQKIRNLKKEIAELNEKTRELEIQWKGEKKYNF